MSPMRALAVAGVAAIAVFAVALRGGCGATSDNVAYAARPRPAKEGERVVELEAPHDAALREPVSAQGVAPDEALAQPALISRAAPASPDQIARWIENLRDDDKHWNASTATWSLRESLPGAFDQLVTVVDSDDEQQRKLALFVLAHSPRSVLIAGAAERYVGELAPDDLPLQRRSTLKAPTDTPIRSTVNNESRAALWLYEHRDDARGALQAAWKRRSGARSALREELAVAALLALDGASRFSFEARELLTTHMRDNDVPRDAALAFDVLNELGAVALPHIDRAWSGADEQQRDYLARLLAEHAPSDPRGADCDECGPSGMTRPSAIDSLTQRWLFVE